jgi:hypothetical protein
MTAPVEVTTRYATSVPDLVAAWAFVMAHIDRIGPEPRIEIAPVWEPSDIADDHPLHFTVVVDGTITEEA